MYSILLKERTLPNLWIVHPPFQIDANLGLVSGIAEMLLQSHEGYIELLPALPNAWETGLFKGLVARGDFEIAVSWKEKEIIYISVLSGSGGRCTLKYTDFENARITNT